MQTFSRVFNVDAFQHSCIAIHSGHTHTHKYTTHLRISHVKHGAHHRSIDGSSVVASAACTNYGFTFSTTFVLLYSLCPSSYPISAHSWESWEDPRDMGVLSRVCVCIWCVCAANIVRSVLPTRITRGCTDSTFDTHNTTRAAALHSIIPSFHLSI